MRHRLDRHGICRSRSPGNDDRGLPFEPVTAARRSGRGGARRGCSTASRAAGEIARPPRLLAAMRHGVLERRQAAAPVSRASRARPCSAATARRALRVAAALECVHCYSLVHDDLPAMDDDDLRRGQPTVHKAFDEATAILAGDSLLTLAFDVIADPATELAAERAQRPGARPGARRGARRHGRRPGARPRGRTPQTGRGRHHHGCRR